MAQSDYNTDTGTVSVSDQNVAGTGLSVSGTFTQGQTQYTGSGVGSLPAMFGTPNTGLVLVLVAAAVLILPRILK